MGEKELTAVEKKLDAIERFLQDQEHNCELVLRTVDPWSDAWDEAWGALHLIRNAQQILKTGEYSKEAYYNQEYGIVLHEEQGKEGQDNE